ncbi:stage II sporulation protein M [Xanthovirga aplysinae]|uniref:stage II sporulation protein M n=1 Tax=Xanthovirga aplysinae TaxID=2529853 RepID=UPI0031B63E83
MAVGIGAISAAKDQTFVRLILGDAYVNATLENISKGDPLAVYKKANEVDMFLGITLNNIRVALFAFGAGLLLSVGTGLILFSNGVMLGAFQYFFYEKGLFFESFRTIWIHGTIEISVIIIAGCAGLVLGNSILFPGTYSRLESFKRGAKHGLKIVISTLPFFILAGFLEGFVTRHNDMPVVLSLLIIGLSFLLISFYYIFYPYYLKHKDYESFH